MGLSTVGRAILVTTSPVLTRSITRQAAELRLELETASTPEQAQSIAGPIDLFFIQEDLDEGDALDRWVAALRAGGTRSAPLIAFSRDPRAESRALARGASDFLKVPCRVEELGTLVRSWLRMHRAGSGVESSPRSVPTAPAPPDPSPEPAGPRGPATILLVDDSSVIHSFVENALRGTGYRLLHANDGLEGLEAATKEVPDLVISDIDMPNLDGFEMCRKLRGKSATEAVPILILSARGKGVDIDRGFDVGANDFLSKPVSENELLSRIEQILSSREQGEQKRERILVVDDSSVQRSVIVQALAQQGFDVVAAKDGLDALAVVETAKPELVITDSEMPEMNGRDLTRNLKADARFEDVPVVMLTAADSPLSRLKSKHAGISAYLTKPFAPDKVVVIAEKLIAERRLLRERKAMSHYLSDSAMHAAAAAAASSGDASSFMRSESRFVTILFSDIVGFTPLTEKLPPEELVSLLNAYFDEMVPIIKDNRGVIDKFIGDAIMAVFGGIDGASPEAGAVSAVTAALAMQAVLRRFNEGRTDAINTRVGINSGTVIMGDIGSRAHRRDYTVIGDNVNIAARLESAGKAGGVVISKSTHELLGARFSSEPLGAIKLKGKSTPHEIFLVTGPSPAASA